MKLLHALCQPGLILCLVILEAVEPHQIIALLTLLIHFLSYFRGLAKKNQLLSFFNVFYLLHLDPTFLSQVH